MILNLFFSWQMETDLQGFNNKEFLYNCICDAIHNIEDKGKLEGVTIKPHQGLEGIPGTPEVAQQMYEQIDKYELFVGDVTTVQKLDETFEDSRNKEMIFFRYGPNCNVYGEYNRALGKYHDAWKQVILLSNTINKTPEEDATVVPFDTRGRRWAIDFYLPDNTAESQAIARKELMGPLENAIRDSAISALNNVRERYEPFDSWFNIRNNGIFKKIVIRKEIVDKYRPQILDGERITSIYGNVSAEKTVLALLSFDDCKSANNCLYVDNHRDDYSEYKKVIKAIFRNKAESQDIILIIDNCSKDVLEKIIKERKAECAGNRVIALMTENDGGKQIDFGKVTYIDVTNDFNNEMDSNLRFAGVTSILDLEKVKKYCEFKTDLVKIITDERDQLTANGEITPLLLTNILLGNKSFPHEREILKAISIFDCIGWKDEKSGELDFIIGNTNIIPIACDRNELIAEARAVIVKHIRRGLIIERGRDITVSPKSMAYQLLSEWLSEVDEVRFRKMISDISECEYRYNLSRELHDQLRVYRSQDDAGSIIRQLLKVGGMFDNFDTLNTTDASLIFSGFAEVYPQEACELLVRVLKSRSIIELQKFTEGRRHIIWILEKMAFKPSLFNEAAELLLLLGLAENEAIGNNATEEFVRLFPCVLPATAATLDNRLAFLQKFAKYKDYRPIIMIALKRALVTMDTYVMGGAETLNGVKSDYYMPRNRDEANRYISGVLQILKDIYHEDNANRPEVLDAIQTHFTSLCLSGFADIIIEIVYTIAKEQADGWDKMQESMVFFKSKILPCLNDDNIVQYEEILRLLTKDDFISRFKRVEKESRCDFADYEKSIQNQRNKYEQIANEIHEQKALTKDLLASLIEVECITSYPFGEVLAKRMNQEEQIQFVLDYVSIVNDKDILRIEILCDFIRGLSVESFDKAIPVLNNCNISYTLFACFGLRNIKPKDKQFELLNQRINEGKSVSTDFIQYWTRIRLDQFQTSDYKDLFSLVLTYSDGFPAVVKMFSFMVYGDKPNDDKELPNMIASAFVNYGNEPIDLLNVDLALHVAERLLIKWDYKELAIRINQAIITYAKQQKTLFSHTYEMESIYRILMAKYFEVIWPDLSLVLLADGKDFWAYYNMKNLLGMDLVNEQEPIILEGNHFEEMLSWCDSHPDLAPARLAGMIRVARQGEFTKEAIILIDKYADQEYVLNELECSLNSFASIGSVVPQYEVRKRIYSSMLEHKNATVRQWAQTQVNSCDYMINKEAQREAEKI